MDPVWVPWLVGGASALSLAGLHVGSWFGGVRGLHDWLVPGARFRGSGQGVVLTFDDGPDPDKTPRLLDALAAAGAPATFFLIGERAARHPGLVRRIAAEGHALGNHSWSHPWLVLRSRRRIEAEVDRCQAAIEDAAGVSPRLARPPYGQRDWRYYQVLRARGLTPVLWSLDLRDYLGTAPPKLLRRLSRARPGELVLAHDGDPLAPHTVDAIEAWLRSRPLVEPLDVD